MSAIRSNATTLASSFPFSAAPVAIANQAPVASAATAVALPPAARLAAVSRVSSPVALQPLPPTPTPPSFVQPPAPTGVQASLAAVTNAVVATATAAVQAAVATLRQAPTPSRIPVLFGSSFAPTPWQEFLLASLALPHSDFTRSSSVLSPSWDEGMANHFFEAEAAEQWSLLPNARQVGAAVLGAGDGPMQLLAADEQLAALQTPLQYRIIRSPEQEATFAVLKANYGAKMYFHGSPLQNWHQIITQGLEPKSGTDMQANGAAHGQGVYVATRSRLSNTFVGNTRTRVLGLVEVIEHPAVRKIMDAAIAPRGMFVALRAVAVYRDEAPIPSFGCGELGSFLAA